jgi:hypothetical protein
MLHTLGVAVVPALISAFIGAAVVQLPTQAVPVIFDTDMDTDADDAGALAMLHAMADAGEVEILATMVSSHYPYSAAVVDIINTYYGRPELPIGVPKQPGASIHRGSRYASGLAAEFPHRVRSNDAAPDAVEVYRRILVNQPDTSVVVVTVGYLTNIRYLLESAPDEWSPLSGKELVRRKVKRWVVAGGRYPEELDPNPVGNFKPDPESAVVAVQHWPRPVAFSGIGRQIMSGESLAGTPSDNPVRRVYELYFGGESGRERGSSDQSALLYAVRGAGSFWKETAQGYNRVFDNGTNQWRSMPDAENQVMVTLAAEPAEVKEIIEEVMSRPPLHGPANPR